MKWDQDIFLLLLDRLLKSLVSTLLITVGAACILEDIWDYKLNCLPDHTLLASIVCCRQVLYTLGFLAILAFLCGWTPVNCRCSERYNCWLCKAPLRWLRSWYGALEVVRKLLLSFWMTRTAIILMSLSCDIMQQLDCSLVPSRHMTNIDQYCYG